MGREPRSCFNLGVSVAELGLPQVPEIKWVFLVVIVATVAIPASWVLTGLSPSSELLSMVITLSGTTCPYLSVVALLCFSSGGAVPKTAVVGMLSV